MKDMTDMKDVYLYMKDMYLYVDEYGSIWNGMPGKAERVGDLINQANGAFGVVYIIKIESQPWGTA